MQVLGNEPVLLFLLLQTSLLFPAGKKAVSDSWEGVKEANGGVKICSSVCGLFASEHRSMSLDGHIMVSERSSFRHNNLFKSII